MSSRAFGCLACRALCRINLFPNRLGDKSPRMVQMFRMSRNHSQVCDRHQGAGAKQNRPAGCTLTLFGRFITSHAVHWPRDINDTRAVELADAGEFEESFAAEPRTTPSLRLLDVGFHILSGSIVAGCAKNREVSRLDRCDSQQCHPATV